MFNLFKKNILKKNALWITKNRSGYDKEVQKMKDKVKKLEFELKKAKFELDVLTTNPYLKRHPKFYTKKKLKIFCHFRNLNYNGKRKTLINRLLKYEKSNNYITWK